MSPTCRDRRKAVTGKTLLLLLLIILGFGFAADAFSQKKDEVKRDLDRARNLERINKYEEALQIHMRLYGSHPDNAQVLMGLERDLLYLKKYSEWIEILQERLEVKPDDPSLLEKLGNALYKSGQEQGAEERWSRIIEKAPYDQASYARVARQYLYNGLIDKSVSTYLLGRKRLDDNSLFARDLARLYTSQLEYGEATKEYVLFLTRDPKQYTYVENMISRFKGTEGKDDEVSEVLEEAVEDYPNDSQLRKLLGSQYLRMAQPEQAFEQFVEVEEIEQANGGILLDFADWSYREGFYSTALQAYRHILELSPKSPLAPKAQQGIGRSLTRLNRPREAIVAFRMLADTYPTSKETESALFEIGKIQLEGLSDPDSALIAFNELVNRRKKSRHYFHALFLIGECYVLKDNLAGALKEYERVREEAIEAPHVAEEAAYRIAETKFFRGDFDGALNEFEALAKAYPKGMFVNDALALIVFIEENRLFGDDALRAFAMAAVLERQEKSDEAITAYERILTYYPHSFLGDDALLHIGTIQSNRANFEKAIETYQHILTKYPGCDQCDEVQRRIGEIYEIGLEDLPKAIEAYDEILSKYPDSLLYDSVRKKIRELQVKVSATG